MPDPDVHGSLLAELGEESKGDKFRSDEVADAALQLANLLMIRHSAELELHTFFYSIPENVKGYVQDEAMRILEEREANSVRGTGTQQ